MVRRAFSAQRANSHAGGSAKPQMLGFASPFCPSDLPVKKSGSCEVVWIRSGDAAIRAPGLALICDDWALFERRRDGSRRLA